MYHFWYWLSIFKLHDCVKILVILVGFRLILQYQNQYINFLLCGWFFSSRVKLIACFVGLSTNQPQLSDRVFGNRTRKIHYWTLNIYWENLVRKFLWNSLFMVDINNHNNIPKELMVMYFIVFSFIIASQFCIPNVI